MGGGDRPWAGGFFTAGFSQCPCLSRDIIRDSYRNSVLRLFGKSVSLLVPSPLSVFLADAYMRRALRPTGMEGVPALAL